MPRRRLTLATIAVVIAVTTGARARAQELSCPPGYAPDQNSTSCVPLQPTAEQGGVAGQAQQLLKSFGAAVQGQASPSNPSGALGGMLNRFGLGGSGAAPQGYNGGPAQGGAGGGAAQAEVGGGAASGPCGFGEYPPCKLAEDACALLAPDVVAAVFGGGWTRKGSGPMRPLPGAALVNDCTYDGPAEDDEVTLTVHDGGRAQFHRAVYNMGRSVTALSGVGDAAYEGRISRGSNDEGKATAQVHLWVIKGGTYFDITVDREGPNLVPGPAGVALARKVADRISLGLGASGAAPQGHNGGTAQNGVGGGSTNDYGGQRVSKISTHDPCSLLTAGDISAVLGSPVTWSSAGAGGPTADTVCSYSTDDHTSITVSVNGGRADFDNNTRQMNSMASQYHMQPLIPVSGVGDKAFMNPPSTGGGGAGRQVYVLKGGTYFYVGVQSDKGDAADARSATVLARKVAERINRH